MSEQDHIIETFTEMASRYESLMNNELNRFWGVSYPKFVNELIHEIVFNDDLRILDVATGTAFIPQFISSQGYPFNRVVGLDITFEMLINARDQILKNKYIKPIQLICASAHAMPFKINNFGIVICCLATHHMQVDTLLDQIYLSLKPGGKFHIGDVGGSKKWRVGIVRAFVKSVAFIYFFFTENLSRARAESAAVANVLTTEEWKNKISFRGFESIKARELKSKRFWVPNPVIIEAIKPMEA